ncbi:MAG TPA: site-specific DNA-methyltransferase [Candidatus Paceibacterota bacterium]|nr:site-specific DNA-methyltransferase [Candidatus Paceibacterota bacterium]
MQNLLEELKKLLEQDERLVVEGKLLKNKIIESALKLDVDLIRLLLKSETIKTHFFQEVDGVLVFDKIKFQKFVSNKAFLPDSYTSFKNKIGLVTENEEYLSESKEAVLVWPYKDCVLEGGMEKENEKRDEIFYNEILAPDEIDRLLEPKVLTNFKRISKNEEHKVTEIKKNDNLIIRGNNLLALHSLQKRFAGKVKLIYIDPPYGKDADSFYNDNFKLSSWLTFMKNRLQIAKSLLDKDGLIIVQISDYNVARLMMLMDEIFEQSNFVNKITVRTKSSAGFKVVNKGVMETAEYLLIYAKNKNDFNPNILSIETEYDKNYSLVVKNPKENIAKWEFSTIQDEISEELKQYEKIIKEKKIFNKIKLSLFGLYALENPGNVFRYTEINDDAGKETLEAKEKSLTNNKIYTVETSRGDIRYIKNGQQISFYSKKIKNVDGRLVPTEMLTNIWNDISWEGIAKEGGVKLKKGKKPEKLIKRLIDLIRKDNNPNLIMDFFLATGTTCAVAHKMNCQYIGIEQLDYGENDSVVRLKNVINGDQSGISKSVNWQGGGDFIYCELMKLNEKYIDEIKKAKTTKQLVDIWKTMEEKAFLNYKIDVGQFDENVNEFEELDLENQKKFLIECLDKNQLYINLSEIDDTENEISEEDKKLNKQFHEVM